jgi:hypothetical protein
VSSPHFTKRKKSSLLNCAGNTAVALAVDNIEETVSKIHAVLTELELEANTHKQRYFSSFRSAGYAPLLSRLAGLQSALDKRLDLLIKVLSLKSVLHLSHFHVLCPLTEPPTPSLVCLHWCSSPASRCSGTITI